MDKSSKTHYECVSTLWGAAIIEGIYSDGNGNYIHSVHWLESGQVRSTPIHREDIPAILNEWVAIEVLKGA